MKLKHNFVLYLIIILSILSSSFISANSVNLLAVIENGEDLIGTVAKMNLEIQTGSGKVFLNTLPFSRLDTQISTRIANSVACSYADKCSENDFLYTIDLNSPSIGGPSAGAAITLLTAANLHDAKIYDDFAITGTINSGGIIGSVGGVEEKVKSAIKSGMKKIAIPYSQSVFKKYNTTKEKIQFNQIKFLFNSTTDDIFYKAKFKNGEMFVLNETKVANFTFDSVTSIYYNNNEPVFINPITTIINNSIDFLIYFDENHDIFTSNSLFEIDDVNIHFTRTDNYDLIDGFNLTSFHNLSDGYYYDFDLKVYANDKGAEVREFVDFEELYTFATGDVLDSNMYELNLSDKYKSVLKNLSMDLCGKLYSNIDKINSHDNLSLFADIDDNFFNTFEQITDQKKTIDSLREEEKYYAAASLCFANSIDSDYLISVINHSENNFSYDYYLNQISELKNETNNHKEFISNLKVNTLIDIQTIGIINNRIREVEYYIDLLDETSFKLNFLNYLKQFNYAKNRLHTAKSWLIFYDKSENFFDLDEQTLFQSCNAKIIEVNERYSFLDAIVDFPLDSFKNSLNEINEYVSEHNYIDCIYESSLLKARLDNILIGSGFGVNQLEDFYSEKEAIVKRNVARQMALGEFPILGYSYLEYANYLKNDSLFNALEFLSLSLELNNLDIYLPNEKKTNKGVLFSYVSRENERYILYFIDFLLISIMVYYFFFRKKTYNNYKPKGLRVIPNSKKDEDDLVKLIDDNKKISNTSAVMVVKPENSDLLFKKINFKLKTEKNSGIFDENFKSELFKKLK